MRSRQLENNAKSAARSTSLKSEAMSSFIEAVPQFVEASPADSRPLRLYTGRGVPVTRSLPTTQPTLFGIGVGIGIGIGPPGSIPMPIPNPTPWRELELACPEVP